MYDEYLVFGNIVAAMNGKIYYGRKLWKVMMSLNTGFFFKISQNFQF